MKGWKTHTFTGKVSMTHRAVGAAENSPIQARFQLGMRDYSIGNHPVWELFRCINQARQKPYVLRGIGLAAGYLWSLLRRVERPVPRELIEFYRREQMRRLKYFFTRKAS
jgi:hypothetical protein